MVLGCHPVMGVHIALVRCGTHLHHGRSVCRRMVHHPALARYTAVMFNVEYDTARGVHTYLAHNCDRATAERLAVQCRERYVGKPYPNGKGVYDVTDVRVVSV